MLSKQPDQYQDFYSEIPHSDTDPFNGFEDNIEDDHEDTDYDELHGLSDEQVSRFAQDALEQHPAGQSVHHQIPSDISFDH